MGIITWSQFRGELSVEHWEQLSATLHNEQTYEELLVTGKSILCETSTGQLAGMTFLIPSGNPTVLYPANWSYIRFLTVHPDHSGKGIGRRLTADCIALARSSNETTIALHTSEMMRPACHLYESLGFKIEREIGPRLGKRYWLYKLDL
nr:N-acetyltransferase [Niabella beijingensis]